MKLTKKFLVGIVTLILILAMIMPVTPVSASPERIETLNMMINELWIQYNELGPLDSEGRLSILARIAGHQREIDELRAAPPPVVPMAPNPRLVSPQNITVNAGETTDVSLTIRNIGTHTAFNYLLQAVPSGPFSIEFLNNSNTAASITENRNITVTMRITVNPNAETGNHTIALTHNFRTQDRDNETRTDTPIQVRVVGEEDAANPNLEIRNITAPTGNVNANATATISFYVHNTGEGAARNIRVVAAPENADIVPVQTASTQSIPNLAPGESQRLTFNFSPRSTASTRSYSIGFTVTCADNTNFSQFTSINVYNPDEDEDTQANLEIRGMTAPAGNIGVSEAATISFYVYNTGDSIARNVRVEATPENAHLVPVQAGRVQTISSIAPGESHMVTFGFMPQSAATTRAYSIGISINGDEMQHAVINVYNPDQDDDLANLIIRNITAPTGRVNVGGTATISFDVTNTGEGIARNIRVEATPESTSAIVPVQTANTQTIASLAPGESHRLTFNFSPTESATTRSYAVGFTVNHAGETFSQFAAINVYNPEQEDEDGGDRVQIPRVMIGGINLTPAIPRAGQEFEMEITFRNTSSTRSVNNIRILMEEVIGTTPTGGQAAHFAGFNPLDGSNTLFVDFLAPLGEVTKVLRFTTVMEARPGAHNMRFSFDYQDQDFAEHRADQQISITVAQVTRLEITDVTISEWAEPMVGSPVAFNYRIINSGRVDLINVRTRTEGDTFDVTYGGRFITPINAQRLADFHGTFTPLEPGLQRGSFIVEGEDTTGEIVYVVHEFEIYVQGGFDFGDMFEGGDMGMGGGRPGMPGGMFIQEYEWCSDTEDFVSAGYWCQDTGEWVPTGERCMETDAWIQFDTGFDFLGLIRRPIVWGPAIGVVVVAAVVVIIIIRKKKTKFNFMDDEE